MDMDKSKDVVKDKKNTQTKEIEASNKGPLLDDQHIQKEKNHTGHSRSEDTTQVQVYHRHQRTFYNQKHLSNHNQKQNMSVRNGESAWSAKERRNEYADKRVKSQTQHSGIKEWTSTEKSGRKDQKKIRSLSTNAAKHVKDVEAVETNPEKGRKGQYHRKSATDVRTTSNNSVSNAESFDYEGMELDEPFSESEDEFTARNRRLHKPTLTIPRGRIRSLSGTIPPIGYSPHWGGPTMCLSCLQFFQLPEMIDEFSTHLLVEHQIIIDGIDIIVDLKRYIEYWRQQFAKRSVDQIFPKIIPKEEDLFYGKVDYYFQLTERIQEDYSLRQRLAMRRLEEALACQQREREDITFSMQCIFCRYTARGNRAKIIYHLYTIHHLNLGSPDNLVFVTEYIEHLREKIQRNECIYCEKTYADRNMLMDHMRKKNHKEVNPKNNYYDKFYIINYLELGKRWLDVLAEDFEDTMPTFVDSDEEEEEDSWHEWQEDNTGEEDICALCLFCEHASESLDEVNNHMRENHKFDLIKYVKEFNLDTYKRMKLVNFLRKRTFNTRTKPDTENKFADIPESDEWDKEENLVPMFGNDHLLWMLESWFLEQERKKEEENAENKKELTGLNEVKNEGRKECIVEFATLVDESKKNTIKGVIAEDLPDLTESILADRELQESLC